MRRWTPEYPDYRVRHRSAECQPHQERRTLGVVVMTPRSSIRLLVATVADEHGLTAKDIYEPGRFAHIHAARRAAIRAVAAAYPTLSSPQIGRLFRRHHTTVLHALGRVKNKTIWREA